MKPINIAIAQSLACKYTRQQRRARRLYVFLCRKELKENPQRLPEIAERAILRGLWTPNGDGTQARQSIISHLYKLEAKERGAGYGLHRFCREFCWDMYRGEFNSFVGQFVEADCGGCE